MNYSSQHSFVYTCVDVTKDSCSTYLNWNAYNSWHNEKSVHTIFALNVCFCTSWSTDYVVPLESDYRSPAFSGGLTSPPAGERESRELSGPGERGGFLRRQLSRRLYGAAAGQVYGDVMLCRRRPVSAF